MAVVDVKVGALAPFAEAVAQLLPALEASVAPYINQRGPLGIRARFTMALHRAWVETAAREQDAGEGLSTISMQGGKVLGELLAGAYSIVALNVRHRADPETAEALAQFKVALIDAFNANFQEAISAPPQHAVRFDKPEAPGHG